MSHNLWNLDENAAKALMTNLRKDPAVHMRVRIEQDSRLLETIESAVGTGERQQIARSLYQDGQLIGSQSSLK